MSGERVTPLSAGGGRGGGGGGGGGVRFDHTDSSGNAGGSFVGMGGRGKRMTEFEQKREAYKRMTKVGHRRTMAGGGATGGAHSKRRRSSSAKMAWIPNKILEMDFFERMALVLKSRWFMTIMTVMTLYALFGDDIRLAMTERPADIVFDVITTIAFVFFCIEFLIQSWVEYASYWMGFYWWLDLASTVTLLLDLNFLKDNEESATSQNAATLTGDDVRTGARSARLLRLVRLVRLVRIVKLFKYTKKEDEEDAAMVVGEPSRVGKLLQSRTERKIIILVLLCVFVLPYLDEGSEPIVDQFQQFGFRELHRLPQDYNQTGDISETYFRNAVENFVIFSGRVLYMSVCREYCNQTWQPEQLHEWIQTIRFPTLVDGTTPNPDPEQNPANHWKASDMIPLQSTEVATIKMLEEKYRPVEMPATVQSGCFRPCSETQCPETYQSTDDRYDVISERYTGCLSLVYFNGKPESQIQAVMNIVKTFFIMICLAVMSITLSNAAQDMVIGPIERMMDMIERIRQDPLRPVIDVNHEGEDDDDDDDDGERKRGGGVFSRKKKKGKKKDASSYESAMLENTLGKIAALMQVGFGAAGADIIRSNMASGELNPMTKGKRITACYMFCDIRNFTDTTECLQEEVMVYVNKIGHIMHGNTHKFYGMANKNVGDAFLLSWKICEGDLPHFNEFSAPVGEPECGEANAWYRNLAEDDKVDHVGASVKKRKVSPTEIADSALHATIKCFIDLNTANTSGSLKEYLTYPAIIKRFGPGFTIRTGFGIHVGWCIEGAIGSTFKIDCTYISPHVEMSDRLEAG